MLDHDSLMGGIFIAAAGAASVGFAAYALWPALRPRSRKPEPDQALPQIGSTAPVRLIRGRTAPHPFKSVVFDDDEECDAVALSLGNAIAMGVDPGFAPAAAFLSHFGDPCIQCDTPHDDVLPGPCPGEPVPAAPIGDPSPSYDPPAAPVCDLPAPSCDSSPSFDTGGSSFDAGSCCGSSDGGSW